MNHLRLLIALAIVFTIGFQPLYAQVTTASISGMVTDNANEALVGANVVAIHEPSRTQYGITTRRMVVLTFQTSELAGRTPFRPPMWATRLKNSKTFS